MMIYITHYLNAIMANLREKFGKRLKSLRLQQGISQEALANQAEIHRTYPSKLENGLRGATLDTIERLAEVLDVEPRELFNFEE